MRRKYIYLFLGLVGIIAIYYWVRAAAFLDPDFGIHMRMGQIILAEGIPARDTLSYSMPSYPAVDHEWLVDILFVWLLPVIGYIGIAGVFTIIAFGALGLQWRAVAKQNRRFIFIPFFLAMTVLGIFFGIRPQVISWFFFSLILFIVRDREHFRKWRWWLPVVFLVWANLHGGFPIGIGTLLAASVYWLFKGKYSIFTTSVVFLLCVGATFITPYGWRTWWEIGMVMADSSLRWTISEWMPAVFTMYFSFWIFFVLSTFLVIRYIKKFTFLDVFLYFGLLVAALSTVRNVPLWAIISLPITTQGLGFFYQEAVKIKYGGSRFVIAMKGLFVMVCFIGILELLVGMFGVLGFNADYPEKAVRYLHLYVPKGQIFSTYEWGGYLLWKLPEKKLFINGRMPHWRRGTHIPGESDYAFEEYGKFLNGELPFRAFTSKYGISTLLMPVEEKDSKNLISEWMDRIDKFVKKSLHTPVDKKVGFSKMVKDVGKAGWVVVYKDEKAVIYQDRRFEVRFSQ